MAIKRVLVLRNAVTGAASFSNKGINITLKALKEAYPALEVIDRDLTVKQVPILTEEIVGAIQQFKVETEVQKRADALATELIEEIKSVDLIVIGLPRYNFGAPATFKAYIDFICRPGVSFKYGANGPEGLLPNVPVWGVMSAGGIYGEDQYHKWVNVVLSFVGLKTIKFLPIEGVGMGKAEESLAAFSASVATSVKEL